jgi:hypothetical protein
MSLKSFHLFFISVSAVLSLVPVVWGIELFLADGKTLDVVIAAVFAVFCLCLVLYEIHFFKKFKNINIL